MYENVGLTLGATPSGDVAGVVVWQDLARGRQSAQLDVVVERRLRGQTQESNIISEDQNRTSIPYTVCTTINKLLFNLLADYLHSCAQTNVLFLL